MGWGNCWYTTYPKLPLINPQPRTQNPQPTTHTDFEPSPISLSDRKLQDSGLGWGNCWTTITPAAMAWGNSWYNNYPQLPLINLQPTTHNPQPSQIWTLASSPSLYMLGNCWTTITPADMAWGNCWYNNYPQLPLINPQPKTNNPEPTQIWTLASSPSRIRNCSVLV
jgi:hypothetical protein